MRVLLAVLCFILPSVNCQTTLNVGVDYVDPNNQPCVYNFIDDCLILGGICGVGFHKGFLDTAATNPQPGPAGEFTSCPPCIIFPCDVICDADCAYGDWTEWAACNTHCGTDGTRSRTRAIKTQSAGNGDACEADECVQSRECNRHECPFDCQIHYWSEWSACNVSCSSPPNIGHQRRERHIVEVQSNRPGSTELCPGTSLRRTGNIYEEETRQCNTYPCPLDCKYGQWTEWTACNKHCGGGSQGRNRQIKQYPVGTGTPCLADRCVESQSCNSQECPYDCIFHYWSEWSSCSAPCSTVSTPGQQTRTRHVEEVQVERPGGTRLCPGLPEEEEGRPCNSFACPVDCSQSQWGDWSGCSATCGWSSKRRYRHTLEPSQNGGNECGAVVEVEECSKPSCHKHSYGYGYGNYGGNSGYGGYSSHDPYSSYGYGNSGGHSGYGGNYDPYSSHDSYSSSHHTPSYGVSSHGYSNPYSSHGSNYNYRHSSPVSHGSSSAYGLLSYSGSGYPHAT